MLNHELDNKIVNLSIDLKIKYYLWYFRSGILSTPW